MEPLAHGTYEGVVVGVDELPDDAVALEVAVTSGEHKGAVVRIRGPRARRDPLDMLGLPATLDVVAEGIRVRIEGG
jgi:hypothetical protein